MKVTTKSEIPQRMLMVLRHLKLLWGLLLLFLFLGLLPEIFLEITLDKATIKDWIREFCRNSQLAITFDDITISAYRGVTLNNIKISHDTDFNRGRILLAAKEFKIRPDYSDFFKGKLKPIGFSVSQADVRFWLENDAFSRELLSQLKDWYVLSENFTIHFNDSNLELNLRRGAYNKDQWVITDISGTFSKTPEMTSLKFEYSNQQWGKGQGHIIAATCFLKECGFNYKYLDWKFDELNLSHLSWLTDSFIVTDGYASGKFVKTQNIESIEDDSFLIKETTIESEVSIKNLSLLKEENVYLSKINLDLSLTNKTTETSRELIASGNYNKTPFELKLVIGKEPLPDYLEFILEDNENPIQLPGNTILKGLNWFKVNFRNEKNNYTHNISAQITSGSLQFRDKFYLEIPFLRVNSSENKFNLQSNLAKNNSNLSLQLEGEVIPFLTTYRSIAYPLMTGYRGPEKNIAAYKIRANGNLITDRFFYSDIRSLLIDLKKMYNQTLIEGLHHSYAPSRIRDREFFKKYIENLNLSLSVNGKEIWLSDRDNLSINGELKTDYTGVKIILHDSTKENELDFQYSYQSNIPFVSGKYNIHLRDGKTLLRDWVDNTIFESFENVKLDYSFNAAGERPADIYLSERGRGEWFFSKVTLGQEARKRYIVPNWDTIKFNGIKTGPLLTINRYEAENQNFILSGTATRKETNLQPQYSFTFQLKQKN